MKLLIDKLGRIEHAELEIRPLTVFVGKNGVNKTWTAYALWRLLQYLTWRTSAIAGVRSMGSSIIKIQPEPVRNRVYGVVDRATPPLRVEDTNDTVEIDVSRYGLLEGIDDPVEFTLFPEQLRTLLRLGDVIGPEARATLHIASDEFRLHDANVSVQLRYAQRSLRMLWTSEDPEVALSVQLRSNTSAEALRERATMLLRAFAQRFLSMGMVLALPAERKALASLYKQLGRDDSLSREVLSEPVLSFVDFLASADALWRTRKGTAMPTALQYLDERILRGSIQFQGAGEDHRLMFLPQHGPALPMHATSSMVRALAGLDLYLRHGARKGDTLIIDEPEMNAHPEAQVAFTELLAFLVNSGVRVVLTTHSPYIVDHLNNLIWARKLSEGEQEAAARAFKLGTRECFLRGEDVAAYLFEDETDDAPVQVKPVFQQDDPEHLIDWGTFSQTSQYLGNLYATEILPRLPKEE